MVEQLVATRHVYGYNELNQVRFLDEGFILCPKQRSKEYQHYNMIFYLAARLSQCCEGRLFINNKGKKYE